MEVIVADTEKEEAQLLADAEILKAKVDQRLLTAFERIRKMLVMVLLSLRFNVMLVVVASARSLLNVNSTSLYTKKSSFVKLVVVSSLMTNW